MKETSFDPEMVIGKDAQLKLGFKVRTLKLRKTDSGDWGTALIGDEKPVYYNAFFMLMQNLNTKVPTGDDSTFEQKELIGTLPVDTHGVSALGYRPITIDDTEFLSMQGITSSDVSKMPVGSIIGILNWWNTPIILQAGPEKDNLRECVLIKNGKRYNFQVGNFNQLSIITEAIKYLS